MSRDLLKFPLRGKPLSPVSLTKIEMSFLLIFLLLALDHCGMGFTCNEDLFESSNCRCANFEELRCSFVDLDSCQKDNTFGALHEMKRIWIEGDYCENLISQLADLEYEEIVFTSSPCPEIINCR